MSDTLTRAAPAKVNLLLRVLAREMSGYHGIETVFARIGLADELTVARRPDAGVTLEVDGADTGPADDNLAVRAARLVLEATGNRFGVHLALRKHIPVGAGLGGGSSDAAAALQAVNGLAGNAVPRPELLQFAAQLGADVPFLLFGAGCALAWGRGDRLFALPSPPRAPLLLVVPPVAIRTADAYAWVDQAREGAGLRRAVVLDADALTTWGSIGRMAGNDFEVPVFGRYPEVRAAFDALVATRPLVCRMTGSGSAVFAVYRSGRDRDDAQQQLSRRLGTVIATETA